MITVHHAKAEMTHASARARQTTQFNSSLRDLPRCRDAELLLSVDAVDGSVFRLSSWMEFQAPKDPPLLQVTHELAYSYFLL